MVENSIAFESTSSFSSERSAGFEVISHSEEEVNSAQQQGQGSEDNISSISDSYAGILILNGAESITFSDETQSVLSVPGTDSLPTSIDSLSQDDLHLQGDFPATAQDKSWKIKKQHALLLLSALVAVVAVGINEITSWRSSSLEFQKRVQEAEQKIQNLEQEVEEHKVQCEAKPGFPDFSDDSDYYTVLDNCWVKAQTRWCDKAMPFSSNGGLPVLLGEAIGGASKIVSEKVASFKEAMKEVPASSEFKGATEAMSQATDVFSVFIGEAGKAFTNELEEFSSGPMDYFASAVKGASQTDKSTKVTLHGFQDAVNVVSSVSNEWTKALERTGLKMRELLEEHLEADKTIQD